MASYVDGAYAYLIALSDSFRQQYFPGIANVLQRHGKTTRLIPSDRAVLNGTSMEFEVTTAENRSTRATMDLMAAMPDPGPGSKTRFTVNFDHTDATANDFVNLEIGFRLTIYDLKKRADSLYKHEDKDYIREDFEEGMADVKETFARYFHLPTDGKMAALPSSGTNKKADDSFTYADASAYSAGDAAALIQLDPTSIARVGIGQMIEFRTAAGALVVDNIKVTYVNYFERTLNISITSDSVDSGGAAETNLDNIANADEIFLNGSYNVAPTGTLAHFFDSSATYYGRDRTTPAYHQLMPLIYKLGTDVALTDDHFRKAGEAVAWQEGSSDASSPRTVVMARDQYRAVNKFAKDAGMTIYPGSSSEIGSKLKRVIGDDGLVLHDPNLGQVALVVDDFAEYGQIDFLDMSTWRMVVPWASSEFTMIPGEIGGMWVRNTENDGTGRPSKIFSANGIWPFTFVNVGAIRNLRVSGLLKTA